MRAWLALPPAIFELLTFIILFVTIYPSLIVASKYHPLKRKHAMATEPHTRGAAVEISVYGCSRPTVQDFVDAAQEQFPGVALHNLEVEYTADDLGIQIQERDQRAFDSIY